ncbi:MAG: hypothetical protein ACXU86_07170 [Archangium sp.]
MNGSAVWMASLLGLLVPSASMGKPMKADGALTPVEPKQVKVTEGKLETLPNGRSSIDVPKMRAVVPSTGEPKARVAELRFTYLGATREQKPLLSGELRRQIGLKLRAQDGCNVVYAMWRIEPKAGLVVSVKHNPGMHRSDDCGNGGYQTVKPRSSSSVPVLGPGDSHTLRAELQGAELTLRVDGRPVWDGTLPPEALTFDGPVGLRSDNGRFEVELLSTP